MCWVKFDIQDGTNREAGILLNINLRNSYLCAFFEFELALYLFLTEKRIHNSGWYLTFAASGFINLNPYYRRRIHMNTTQHGYLASW